jgi:hypothetical protein
MSQTYFITRAEAVTEAIPTGLDRLSSSDDIQTSYTQTTFQDWLVGSKSMCAPMHQKHAYLRRFPSKPT